MNRLELIGTISEHLSVPANLRQFRAALQEIAQPGQTVEIYLDGPGGGNFGVQETVDLIEHLRGGGATIHAFGANRLLSAHYWIACACDSITVAPDCLVGSVGAYRLLEAFDSDGLTLIRSGGSDSLKGEGEDGRVTDRLVEQVRQINDHLATSFEAYVLDRRQISSIQHGAIWYGPEALELGLVDAVRHHHRGTSNMTQNEQQTADSAVDPANAQTGAFLGAFFRALGPVLGFGESHREPEPVPEPVQLSAESRAIVDRLPAQLKGQKAEDLVRLCQENGLTAELDQLAKFERPSQLQETATVEPLKARGKFTQAHPNLTEARLAQLARRNPAVRKILAEGGDDA